MKKTKLSAPWVVFYRKIEALFSEDPDVSVRFDEEDMNVIVRVKGTEKAAAIAALLPISRTFGDVKARVTVVPANSDDVHNLLDILRKAFDGNKALEYVTHEKTMFGEMNYAVFANKVVQFFNDDISDLHGVCSTLYQDLAKDLLCTGSAVKWCTALPDEK